MDTAECITVSMGKLQLKDVGQKRAKLKEKLRNVNIAFIVNVQLPLELKASNNALSENVSTDEK